MAKLVNAADAAAADAANENEDAAGIASDPAAPQPLPQPVIAPSVPTITGAPCPVNGYRIRECPNVRTYRGRLNGGHWYECDVCGSGELGPKPND